ncbi:EAL domain protein [Burkholderia mallei]|nr:EAL domain protein [Burkholderia mallei]
MRSRPSRSSALACSSAATYGARRACCARVRSATRSRSAADSVSMTPAAACGCTGSTLGPAKYCPCTKSTSHSSAISASRSVVMPPISTSCPDSCSSDTRPGSTRSRCECSLACARMPRSSVTMSGCRCQTRSMFECFAPKPPSAIRKPALRRPSTIAAKRGVSPPACSGTSSTTRCGGSPSAFRFARSASP